MATPREEARRYSVAEYLKMEDASETKHEYYDGEIVAFPGVSIEHDTIALNASATLRLRLRGTDCRVFTSDVRVRTAGRMYAYPDVKVACGERRFTEESVPALLNPVLIVEVLSPSTRGYDRGDKFVQYRTVPTLREYVLIEQTRVHVEQFRRGEGGLWILREYKDLGETLQLESIGVSLPLATVYEDVELGPEE
ncbi:MAG: Uma2 family endonuclease [Chloroflexi bacterium]|nr:Uma2 family endonuclease [Chloroflexota bacterium]